MKIWVPVIKLKAIEFGGTKHTPKFTEGQPIYHRPAKKRRAKLATTVALVLLVALGLVWLIIRTLNAPAEGSIDNTGGSVSASHAQAPGNYDDSYISFKYPGSFTVLAPQKAPNDLVSIRMLSDDHPSVYMAMSLVTESLTNDSGLNYRDLHPELYKTIKDSTDTKVFSRDQGGAEYTGFISHNGMVMAISLTSVRPVHLPDYYNFIADSLNWKQ